MILHTERGKTIWNYVELEVVVGSGVDAIDALENGLK